MFYCLRWPSSTQQQYIHSPFFQSFFITVICRIIVICYLKTNVPIAVLFLRNGMILLQVAIEISASCTKKPVFQTATMEIHPEFLDSIFHHLKSKEVSNASALYVGTKVFSFPSNQAISFKLLGNLCVSSRKQD